MRLLKWNYVEGTATAKETATADCSNTREDVHTVTGKGDRQCGQPRRWKQKHSVPKAEREGENRRELTVTGDSH